MSDRRILATVRTPVLAFPAGKRTARNRRSLPVPPAGSGSTMELIFPVAADLSRGATLRLSAAVDERTAHRVEVRNRRSGHLYGIMEVLFATPGEVFELELAPGNAHEAGQDGLSLQTGNASGAFWVYGPGAGTVPPKALWPHLLPAGKSAGRERFLELFCSEATLQPANWMEACVLDGLRDWAALGRADAARALRAHLDTFFRPDGRFVHEDNRSHPADDVPPGVENTGIFAVAAGEMPDHPWIEQAEKNWRNRTRQPAGGVYDRRIVAETSYSVAYPMMALARFARRPHLEKKALLQLEVNRMYLAEADAIWLRHDPESGMKTFRNWSRGVAWYFIGLVRTLALLPPRERPPVLVEEAARVAAWCAERQQKDGLWSCFLGEPEILPDTSGSAGIGAALALGVRAGILGPERRTNAVKTLRGLEAWLAPDGWLRGASQANKPECLELDLQRARFRVIAPWGMGLLAQLYAALAS